MIRLVMLILLLLLLRGLLLTFVATDGVRNSLDRHQHVGQEIVQLAVAIILGTSLAGETGWRNARALEATINHSTAGDARVHRQRQRTPHRLAPIGLTTDYDLRRMTHTSSRTTPGPTSTSQRILILIVRTGTSTSTVSVFYHIPVVTSGVTVVVVTIVTGVTFTRDLVTPL